MCLLLAGLSWRTSPARGESRATYLLVKSNIGPGQSGSSGAYTLSSSAGQPDAGEVSAGSYTLGGGFWGGGTIVSVVAPNFVYLPLVVR
jgi:hypothetical protein